MLTRCRPASVSKDKFIAKENGQPLGELDEATRLKAEAHYFNFFEFFGEADPKATGVAEFH